MQIRSRLLIGLLLTSLCLGEAAAAVTVIKNKNIVTARFTPTMEADKHLEMGLLCIEQGKWAAAKNNFQIILQAYPNSEQILDAKFLLGTCLYHSRDFDCAEKMFDAYLQEGGATYFELCLKYLFQTAEQYRLGGKRHLFGVESMPAWLPGYKESEEIYDSLISAYPGHEYAAQALIGRGKLLRDRRRYADAVSSFQTFIQRFPNHESVRDAYCEIADTYLVQAKKECRNSDLLTLADINLKQFSARFPREERIEKLDGMLDDMREVYARALFDTAQFYERKNKPTAAVIYYMNAQRGFPNTAVAESCEKRLEDMGPAVAELTLPGENVL